MAAFLYCMKQTLFFLCCALASVATQADDFLIFSNTQLHASAEPVSIYQMTDGWKGKFKGGNFAFIDARFENGFAYQGYQLSYEKRWYAGLKFSEDSARFYYNTEHGIKTNQEYDLNLRLRMLEAEGLNISKAFRWGDLSIQPVAHWYQIERYQLATVRGKVTDQQGLSASAEVDYFYHQDQLLEDPYEGGRGYGGALDLLINYEWLNWQLGLQLFDLWNYWYFPDAAHTYGCVNFQGTATPVCDTDNDNYSRPSKADTQIPITLYASGHYRPWLLQIAAYQHSRYQRLSVQKDWSSPVGLMGVSAHSTGQLGLHWRSYWHHFSVLSDNLRYQKAHNLQLQLGFSWAF